MKAIEYDLETIEQKVQKHRTNRNLYGSVLVASFGMILFGVVFALKGTQDFIYSAVCVGYFVIGMGFMLVIVSYGHARVSSRKLKKWSHRQHELQQVSTAV